MSNKKANQHALANALCRPVCYDNKVAQCEVYLLSRGDCGLRGSLRARHVKPQNVVMTFGITIAQDLSEYYRVYVKYLA